jgi:hypothetical protein
MHNHPGTIHPQHCFCQIPDSELMYWVKKRYLEKIPTLDLLDSTDDPHEREVISIISMLDLDEDTMLELMGDVEMPIHHIVHCREHVKKLLGLDRVIPHKS